MTQYGTWVSYSGNARLILAIILLVCAGGVSGGAYGARLIFGVSITESSVTPE